jgi:AcrR family transcriptional regulator
VPTATSAEPRKRPRQRRSRETVTRILDASARIFGARGYRSTTTNEIAEAAGVSIGSLYQYFPNKDALLVALAERHVEDASAAFADRLADLGRQAPALPVVARELVSLAVEVNAEPSLGRLLFDEAPRTPEVRRRLDALVSGIAAAVADILRRAGAGGADPEVRARLLVAMVDSAVHEVVLRVDPASTRDEATGELVELLLHGLGERPGDPCPASPFDGPT